MPVVEIFTDVPTNKLSLPLKDDSKIDNSFTSNQPVLFQLLLKTLRHKNSLTHLYVLLFLLQLPVAAEAKKRRAPKGTWSYAMSSCKKIFSETRPTNKHHTVIKSSYTFLCCPYNTPVVLQRSLLPFSLSGCEAKFHITIC